MCAIAGLSHTVLKAWSGAATCKRGLIRGGGGGGGEGCESPSICW